MRYRTRQKLKIFLVLLVIFSFPIVIAFITKKEANLDIRNFASNQEVLINEQYINLDEFFIVAKIQNSVSQQTFKRNVFSSFLYAQDINKDNNIVTENQNETQTYVGSIITFSFSLLENEKPENVAFVFNEKAFKLLSSEQEIYDSYRSYKKIVFKLQALQSGRYTVKAVVYNRRPNTKVINSDKAFTLPQDARQISWSVSVLNSNEEFSRACKQDSDCVVVNKPFLCCSSNNYDKQAVNRKSYLTVKERKCPYNIKCRDVYLGDAVCQNNICQVANPEFNNNNFELSHACQKDSDCVVVNKPFTCCFNINGEKQAVNIHSYQAVKLHNCPKDLMCPDVSTDDAICQNNVCQLAASPSAEKIIKAIQFKPKIISDNDREKVEAEFCKATGGIVEKGRCVFKLTPPNEKSYDLYEYMCSCLEGSEVFCNNASLAPIISDCPSNSLDKSVIKPVYSNLDGTMIKASFNSANLLKNVTYEIEVNACTDASCVKPFVNSVKSKPFVLTSPYLEGTVDTKDSCIFNNVKLKIGKTNARWVNVIAYKENVLVSNTFQQLKFIDNHYTGEFAIPSTPNANLNIKVYGCDSNDRKSCVTELKSFKLKTDTCEDVQQVDLEVVHASVDSNVNVGDLIPITIVLRNNSKERFGPINLNISYYEKNDVTNQYNKTISISAIRGGEIFSTTLNLDAIQKEGQYLGSVTTSIANTAYKDRNPQNNKTYFSFVAVQPNFVCDKSCDPGQILTDDCRCVECVDDVNCNGLSVCDLSSNKCVPDYEACAPNKVPNDKLTACVCPEPCNAGQWQDNNCVCHDQKTCNKTCGEKEILAPDCVCEPVECVTDKDCSGLSKCDVATHTCQCSLTCPTGFIVDDACNSCVCASSCPEGYIQRSDCSCQAKHEENNEPKENRQEANFTKLSIVSPINGQKFIVGEKIILSYRIADGEEPDSVSWFIDDENVSTKNNDTVILDKAGDLSVILKVDGTVMDSVDIFVADEDIAKLQKLVSKTTETNNDKSSKLIRYLAIGLSITVTLAVMTFLLVK